MLILELAFRNLWRNRRRTLLTLSAMVVSSALLILSLGVFSGMLTDMLASATEQYHGHALITADGYQEDRDMFTSLPENMPSLDFLHTRTDLTGHSPRLRGFGLLSRGDSTQPAELLGIVPSLERSVTQLQSQITSGQPFSPGETDGALIGAGLAQKLDARPGDELVFVTQAADGSIGNELLRVKGIFETGDFARDNALALVNLPWLQQVMVLPEQIHEIALRMNNPLHAAKVSQAIRTELPKQVDILDWGALLPEMREVIASYDVSRMILMIILYSATGLGILNTFFMSVLERTREFGILMALGFRPSAVKRMVLLESLVLGAISLVLGVTLGLLMSWYMQTVGIDLSRYMTPVTYAGGTILPRLHAVIEWKNIVLPALILLLVSLSAGYFPARRASRLQPIDAIRED